MTEKKTVADVAGIVDKHILADEITRLWSTHNMDRQPWIAQRAELRDYLFATDTTTTTNAALPWKNKTTRPKLTQIRDNLEANYKSALFPNDDWLEWDGYDEDAVTAAKRKAVLAYMKNKLRESGFIETVGEMLLDYIDNGNVFYDTIFVNESTTDPETGASIPGYIGPKIVRISYRDIVFNPQASSFDNTYKIVRYRKSFGQLMQEIEDYPELGYNKDIIMNAAKLRGGGYGLGPDDMNLIQAYAMDGFGSFSEYINSGEVEILEFEGSLYDYNAQKLYKNHIITVVDRCWVVRAVPMASWLGKSTKGHAYWRKRPDNLYGMGPLDNLVGMQYRIDHLENLKADAQDLSVIPPLVVTGNVEDFTWQPGERIYAGEGGQVAELGKNLNGVIGAANEIAQLEQMMEEMAGAPKQAMGIRTPGEKTAFEVQTLEMAASRIFQQKIRQFEILVLEPALNRMLEIARRNMVGSDLVRVLDDDLGVAEFLSVTKEDITAAGKLRPIGARHFAEQAVLVQNLSGIFNSSAMVDSGIRVHWSGKRLAQILERLLGLSKFELFQENAQVLESAETEHLRQEAMNQIAEANATPLEPAPIEGAEAV